MRGRRESANIWVLLQARERSRHTGPLSIQEGHSSPCYRPAVGIWATTISSVLSIVYKKPEGCPGQRPGFLKRLKQKKSRPEPK